MGEHDHGPSSAEIHAAAEGAAHGAAHAVEEAHHDEHGHADHHASSPAAHIDHAPPFPHVEHEYIPSAIDTHDAVGGKLAQVMSEWVQRPETGRSKVRAVGIPLVSALSSGVFGQGFKDVTTFTKVAAPIYSASSAAMALTPLALATRRALGAERMPQLFARMAIKKGEKNIFKRIARGAESWWVKRVVFNENREMKTLMSFVNPDGTLNADKIDQGYGYEPKFWDKLVNEGFYKKAMLDAIKHAGADLSEADAPHLAKMDMAYQVAQAISQKKWSAARRHNFAHFEFSDNLKKREVKDWLKAGAGITAIGMAKAATLVGVVDFLASDTVREITGKIGEGASSFAKQVPGWVDSTKTYINDKLNGVYNWVHSTAQGITWPWDAASVQNMADAAGQSINSLRLPTVLANVPDLARSAASTTVNGVTYNNLGTEAIKAQWPTISEAFKRCISTLGVKGPRLSYIT